MPQKTFFKWSFPIFSTLAIVLILSVAVTNAQENGAPAKNQPIISLPEDMSGAAAREVGQVGKELRSQARSLFEKTPLGWNRSTIDDLAGWVINLPKRVPLFWEYAQEQGRLLGLAGALLLLAALLAVLYSFLWQDRVITRVEVLLQPLT